MKLRFCLMPIILILLPVVGFSQANSAYDSLVAIYQTHPENIAKAKLLDKLHNLVLYKDIELAKKYADEQLEIATKLKDDENIGFGNFNIGTYYKNLGIKDTAKLYFVKSKQIFKTINHLSGETLSDKSIAILELATGNADAALTIIDQVIANRIVLKDSSGLASDYNFKGGIYEHKGNLKLALESVLKAIDIHEQQGNQIGKADALLSLANLEAADNHLNKAIAYNVEALKIYDAEGDIFYSALAHSSIAASYITLKNYEKAKNYIEIALEKAEAVNSLDLIGDAKTKLGTILYHLEDYDEAIKILNEALVINKKSELTFNQMRNLHKIGEAYFKMGQLDNALSYINQSITLAESISAPEILYSAYFVRSDILKQKQNYKSALQDLSQSKLIQDSIFNTEKSKQIERLRTEFDTERKEKELIIEKDKVEILEKEAQVSKLQKLLLALGLGFSVLIGALGFYGFRQKINRDKLEKEKLDAELDFKKKELTTYALHLAKKNELLGSLKKKATTLKAAENPQNGYQKLINSINFDLQDDNNWENFSKHFVEVHKDFNSTAIKKYPAITKNDLRIMALIKMNLSSKEIANILNISIPGIKKARQRLRKKMQLETSDSLETAILNI